MKHPITSSHVVHLPRLIVLALGLLAILNPQARAAVLIEDNFNRGSVETPLALNGSTPTTSGIGSVTWTAASWVTNGTQATMNTGRANGIFSYSFTSGLVYTITATIDVTETSGTNFIGLAFYGTSPGTGSIILSGSDKQGILLRANGQVTGIFNGANAGTLGTGYSGAVTLSAILDTTATAWTLSYAINGISVGSTQTFTTNPTLTGFGFGSNNVGGTVDNFSLTAVPEPSTLALGIFAIAGMAAIGRRSRRLS